MNWRNWPWREQRTDAYTQALTEFLQRQANAESSPASVYHSGALEACAGLVGRAFASAQVEGSPMYARAISPAVLHLAGRQLITEGEAVFLIETGDGSLQLQPVGVWDIDGQPDPRTWVYRCELSSPSGDVRKSSPAAGILHFQYAQAPGRPWEGVGPLQNALITGRLNAEINQLLADEASGARGNVLPIPATDGNDPTIAVLKKDIGALEGKTAFVESMAAEWGAGTRGPTAYADWQPKRLGPVTPESLVTLRNDSDRAVADACGIPPSLLENADGTGQREAWRRFLFGVIAPLGRMFESEMQAKDIDIRLTWDELRASDLQGRARAYGSMVDAGIQPADAARLAGLDLQEAPTTPESENSPDMPL